MSAFVMYMSFCVFAICMSGDSIFLSLYKLALTFYLLTVFLIGGIEIGSQGIRRGNRRDYIKVTLDVDLGNNLSIPNIDLITILANAYENAIYGCVEVKNSQKTGNDMCTRFLPVLQYF